MEFEQCQKCGSKNYIWDGGEVVGKKLECWWLCLDCGETTGTAESAEDL